MPDQPGVARARRSRRTPSPDAHAQIPRALLDATDVGPLAVAAWCVYEALEVRDIAGGRRPAEPSRKWLADRLGVSIPALDRARAQLLAAGEAGPWLAREIRGRKKTARHRVLQRPRESGQAYVAVPAWTLHRIGGRAAAGTAAPTLAEHATVSPQAWHLYAVLCDRLTAGRRKELTLTRIGEWIGASHDTAARRLVELERAGWVQVTHSPGNWLTVRLVADVAEVDQVAAAYLHTGRERVVQRPLDPPQIRRLTHRRSDDSPTAKTSTPQETPGEEASGEEAPPPPAAGEAEVVSAPAPAAARRTEQTPQQSARPPGEAVAVRPGDVARLYWSLPQALTSRIPAHGSRRVNGAIRAELTRGTRTAAELAERIARRWLAGEWDPSTIVDPTAVAITLVRLPGIPCPRVRCEDGHDLDTGDPCTACTGTARPPTRPVSRPAAGPASSTPPPPPAAADVLNAMRPDRPGTSTGPGIAAFRQAMEALRARPVAVSDPPAFTK